ncbi:YegP family protein [Tenacibaculum amylolyticum]|uniref:YegP family protein n=1 Tax=Tenacibaculum amylolyticum TaxID=104269 RepID=UPI003894AA70
MGNPKFEITERSNGDFMFNLKAGNGEIILTSQGYATKQGCKNGIDSVKTNASDEENYEKKTASNGKYYFNLKATNGQIIGTSQMYASTSGRDNGIQSVMNNAPNASVIDFTA